MNHLVSQAPSAPGVYLFKSSAGKVIYVGKAVDLKKRLATYFTAARQTDPKTQILKKQIASFETIITSTENEALILEANLIRRYKPRYNVVLKDDKRYPSLRLDITSEYPNLSIVRKPAKDGAMYFGPFSSARSVRETLKFIHRIYKLRKCKSSQFRRRSRPCLNYQIGGCLGPCCFDVDHKLYDEMVKEVILFLKGRTPALINKIKHRMIEASDKQDYETAAQLRDRMTALEKTIEKQVCVTTDFKDRDVYGIAGSDSISVITGLFVRKGYLQGSRHFVFTDALGTEQEMMRTFIHQYYENGRFIPKEIIFPVVLEDGQLLEQWLTRLRGSKVTIRRAQRGEKARLQNMAMQNAAKELADQTAALENEVQMLTRLQKRLGMAYRPDRIECIDNSNLFGKSPVAGIVVFDKGKPDKSGYRKYHIRSRQTPDDYATMAEVLTRRYIETDHRMPLPDLLMVDGGKGQLNIAFSVIESLNLSNKMEVVSIAKADPKKGETEDKIYKPGRSNPIIFGNDRDLLLFLQRIRDETHRFAITFHRNQYRKTAVASALDSIRGIGPQKKRMLLDHFGSIRNIRGADIDELIQLPGITRSLASSIKAHLTDMEGH